MSDTKVECGNIEEPPSRSKVTVWCIVELVVMAIIGVNCIYGFAENAKLGSLWNILALVGNGFGIAGLIFVILSLWKENGGLMKTGTICFAIALIINIVIFVFFLIDGNINFSSIAHFALDVFLCYVFWVQSGHFGSS